MSNTDAPLILLPGMGADARMFESLQGSLPQLVTPNWIEPLWTESLNEYAFRLAKGIDPGVPCFVGGASFGGVVALEVAAALPSVRACFLIGSIRSPQSLPFRVKMLRPLTPCIGLLPAFAWLIPPIVGALFGPRAKRIARQFADADRRFLRWASKAILTWKPSPAVAAVRVMQIHGARDPIFPVHLTQPDLVIADAGHVVSVTHPELTTQFLLSRMSSFSQ